MNIPNSDKIPIGQLGDYDLLEEIAAGGMGVVYLARQRKLDRIVALKVVLAGAMAREDELKRFRLEAAAAARLDHPNIVSVFEIGEEQGRLYFTMPFVPGPPLSAKITAGVLGNREAAELVRQIALGVDFAHRHGVVHRDLKPSNILIDPDGRPRITDFGLAKHLDLEHSLTGMGQVLGTPGYMAPEQAAGANDLIGPRTDVYGLGAILFALLTGRPPFEGASSHEVLLKVAEELPTSPRKLSPSVSRDMEAICLKCLAKNPQDRYATAADLATDLDHVIRNEPVSVRSSSRSGRALHWIRNHQTPVITVAAVLVCVLVIAFTNSQPKSATPVEAAKIDSGKLSPNDFGVPASQTGAIEIPSNPGAEAVAGSDQAKTRAEWNGWSADAPRPAIAPFDAEQAKKHQEDWASYCKVPVEYTNSIGMKFRLIPPGEFTMGSTPEEIEETIVASDNNPSWKNFAQSEAPQHKVILTRPIYLGVCEVTQGQYERVMKNNPSNFSPTGAGRNAAGGQDTTNYPVEMVSWNDAAEFCMKLSEWEKAKPFYVQTGETVTLQDGTGYRLATEAEWEFACRAGTTTRFCGGDEDDDLMQVGWFGESSSGRQRAHEVGKLMSNPFGLFDMHGNVWEWVQDGWDSTYYGEFQDKPAINPNGPPHADTLRVNRGGVWFAPSSYCRSSHRVSAITTRRIRTLGFRVVLITDAVVAATTQSSGSGVTTRYEWPKDTPAPAVVPFDAEQARQHQVGWAKHLGVPTEWTNSIGMELR